MRGLDPLDSKSPAVALGNGEIGDVRGEQSARRAARHWFAVEAFQSDPAAGEDTLERLRLGKVQRIRTELDNLPASIRQEQPVTAGTHGHEMQAGRRIGKGELRSIRRNGFPPDRNPLASGEVVEDLTTDRRGRGSGRILGESPFRQPYEADPR